MNVTHRVLWLQPWTQQPLSFQETAHWLQPAGNMSEAFCRLQSHNLQTEEERLQPESHKVISAWTENKAYVLKAA